MSQMQAPSRQLVVPPEKGSFPLDHFQECRTEMNNYIKCLKDNHNVAELCKPFSKAYLECRISKGLMAKEDLKNWGF